MEAIHVIRVFEELWEGLEEFFGEEWPETEMQLQELIGELSLAESKDEISQIVMRMVRVISPCETARLEFLEELKFTQETERLRNGNQTPSHEISAHKTGWAQEQPEYLKKIQILNQTAIPQEGRFTNIDYPEQAIRGQETYVQVQLTLNHSLKNKLVTFFPKILTKEAVQIKFEYFEGEIELLEKSWGELSLIEGKDYDKLQGNFKN